MNPRRVAGALGARRCLRWLVVLAGAVVAVACAGPVAAGRPDAPLRVGTSGDYAPLSFLDPSGELTGFDVELARAFARDRGYRLELVRFRWPDLLADLAAGRFDLAMSGVTVGAERSVAGRFAIPVVESGACVLAPAGMPFDPRATPRVAVNAGGHLERVARSLLRGAQIVAIPDNGAVLMALLERRADAVVTDSLEAPVWSERARAAGLEPGDCHRLTHDRKAPLVRADREALARELDGWLLSAASQAFARSLRDRFLSGAPGGPVDAAGAAQAAVAERLALAPLVAQAKRGAGREPRDPAREAVVTDGFWRATRAAALELGLAPPPEATVRALARDLLDASVAIQARELAAGSAARGAPPFDLVTQLRPALDRIDRKLAWLLPQLDPAALALLRQSAYHAATPETEPLR